MPRLAGAAPEQHDRSDQARGTADGVPGTYWNSISFSYLHRWQFWRIRFPPSRGRGRRRGPWDHRPDAGSLVRGHVRLPPASSGDAATIRAQLGDLAPGATATVAVLVLTN